MTRDELIAGARREMLRNIMIAPIVLFVRLPLGLIYATASLLCEWLNRIGRYVPGWRRDYAQALRHHRSTQSTLWD